MYILVGALTSFSCKKGEFDRCFNRLDRLVEESRPDRFPSLSALQSYAMNCALLFWQLFWNRMGRAFEPPNVLLVLFQWLFSKIGEPLFEGLLAQNSTKCYFSNEATFTLGKQLCMIWLITEWTLFASTSMSSFEAGTGTGSKIRSFNFCSSSSTYLLQNVRRTFRNILAWFWILLLTWNLIYKWS